MIAKKIKILIKSDGSYLDTILPPITANEDGRTIVQVIAPFPITDIVSVNYSISPIQATVKGSYLVPTGKFGKDVLADDYTHFQTVADWNVFEIPINAVALEYISKYRAGLVLVSFTIKQLQTPYFATNYLGLFSDTNPIPTTSYNDSDYFIANEYNFTAHDITWAKGDYAYFYNGKWNKGKSVLKASTPSIELPVDPSLKDAPQLEYDEDVALLLANDLGLLTQRVSQAETDIESAENDINEIDGRVGVNETDIYNLESDVGNLQSDKADKTELDKKVDKTSIVDNLTTNDTTKVLSAKQGKVLQDTKEALSNKAQDFTTINETLYPSVQATKTELDKKVDKILTIIGLDLQDNILIGEFRTALGNATQSVAGLLSAEDKTHLDGLVALLETSDGNNVVDTIGEILAIFQNYPEGADLVTALAGKVDKVAGKGLSTEDYTSAEKTKLSGIQAGAEVNEVNSVNGKTGTVVLDAEDVGALPDDTPIPAKVSDLDNDEGFVKGSDLETTLLDYVEKEAGKGLSANDYTNTDKNKVDNIDQVYTSAEKTKLSGIETGAQVNPTGLQVKTLYEGNADTNAFTDDEKDKLSGVEAGAEVNEVNSVNGKQGTVVLDQDDIEDGTSYKRVSQAEKDTWNDKQDKLVAGDNITIDANNVISASGGSGGEVDPNAMAYFNYAGSIYGDKYSLLPNAWESSLAVDRPEISENSVQSNPRGKAQYLNGEIEGVIIPQGVATIGNYAFYNWRANNQPLVIPQGVTSIGLNAFSYWEANNQPLVIPNSVTSIGSSAFFGWSANNQPLVISNSVTSIGSGAFQSWGSNTHPLVIPNSVTSIGGYAFGSWNSNTHPLVIPNSVTSIGNYAFANWGSNNQPLVIPNSVTSIGNYAFANWGSNNQPLVIPNSVTSIGIQAFSGWSLVPYVEIQATTPPTLTNINAFDGQNDAPIYVPDESVDAYKTATNWVSLADRIFPISDKDNTYTKGEIDLMIGDIDTILDSILGV